MQKNLSEDTPAGVWQVKDLIKILKGLSHAHVPDCLYGPETELAVRRQERSSRVWGRPSGGQSCKRLEACSWRWKQESHESLPWAPALTTATLLRTLRQVKAAVKPPARKGETRRKINREKTNLKWCRLLGKQLGTCIYSCSGTLGNVTPLAQPFIPGIYQREGSWIPQNHCTQHAQQS